MLNLKTAAMGAMATVLLCGTLAHAQRTPSNDSRTVKAPAPDMTAKGSVLTTDELAKSLKDIGFQPNVVRPDHGIPIIQLDIASNGRVVPLDLEISKDNTKVWMSIWFSQLKQDETIPNDILMQILEANARFGPCHFTLSGSKQLVLACPLDNRSLTTEELRRQIDIMVQVYNQTERLWNRNNWVK